MLARCLLVVVPLVGSIQGARSAGDAVGAGQDLLAAPGNFSFEPGAAPASGSGGVVSTSVGSGGAHGSAIQLFSGLLGGDTHAFMSIEGGEAPSWHDGPKLHSNNVAVGVTADLPGQSSVTVEVVAEHDRWSAR